MNKLVSLSAIVLMACGGFLLLPGISDADAPGCGELTQDSVLLSEFDTSPASLTGRSDPAFLAEIQSTPNQGELQRIAIARSIIWDDILIYRTVGEVPSDLPAGAGTWRTGRVTSNVTNKTFDVAHWQDIDDGSFSIYFKKGTTSVCGVVFEN